MYDRLERTAVDSLLSPAPHGARLLEVGCGTGHWSECFAGKGYAVTGVDISEPMIAMARRRNVTGAAFEVADAQNLPSADSSFDAAAAITVLEFTADPARVVSEMTRCVKRRGGMLIFGVLNRLSAYNRSRKRRTASMYAAAQLFSPSDLRALLTPSGEPIIRVAGFVPGWDSLVWLSPLLERLGRLTGSEHGAFLAAKVVL
jgi:ubiquinone/menaquinone biosynthesis C-methylase UbiE